MSKEEREREVWASFVLRLRSQGYWGTPSEKHRRYFRGFYDEYLESGRDDHAWEDKHCCDGLDEDDGLVHERCWMFWTDEDRKKADEEYERIKRGEG